MEFVPAGYDSSLRYEPGELERGSPFGFGPTRMLPGWDIVGCDDATEYRHHAKASPAPDTLRSLKRTATGAVLECPGHTIEIDRVWYWLAQEQGLVAERDVEAYAIGWWQERDYAGGPYGVVNFAFDAPQRIWGFHHPPGAPNARWMYLDKWPIDVKPLPASAGKAFWAVEFVWRGEKSSLVSPELSLQVPRRTVDGTPARSPANNPVVLAGGKPENLNSVGRDIVSQPLPVLAGLCGLKDAERIIAFAWDCAVWATDNEIAGETWPAAHYRFWKHVWESGKRMQYL